MPAPSDIPRISVKVTKDGTKRRFSAESYQHLQATVNMLFGEVCVLQSRPSGLVVSSEAEMLRESTAQGGCWFLDLAAEGTGRVAAAPAPRRQQPTTQAERRMWMAEQLSDMLREEEGTMIAEENPADTAQKEEWDDDATSDTSEEEAAPCRDAPARVVTLSQRSIARMQRRKLRHKPNTAKNKERRPPAPETDMKDEDVDDDKVLTVPQQSSRQEREEAAAPETEEEEEEAFSQGEDGADSVRIRLSAQHTSCSGEPDEGVDDLLDDYVFWLVRENERLSRRVALLEQQRGSSFNRSLSLPPRPRPCSPFSAPPQASLCEVPEDLMPYF